MPRNATTNNNIKRELAGHFDMDLKEVEVKDYDSGTKRIHLRGIPGMTGRDMQDIAVVLGAPLSKLQFFFGENLLIIDCKR
jgi:hypothetical protein